MPRPVSRSLCLRTNALDHPNGAKNARSWNSHPRPFRLHPMSRGPRVDTCRRRSRRAGAARPSFQRTPVTGVARAQTRDPTAHNAPGIGRISSVVVAPVAGRWRERRERSRAAVCGTAIGPSPASGFVAEQAYAEPDSPSAARFQSLEVAEYWARGLHRSRDQVQRLRNRHQIELGPRQPGVSRA